MTKVQIFCTILPHTIKRFNKTKSLVVKLGFYLLVPRRDLNQMHTILKYNDFYQKNLGF